MLAELGLIIIILGWLVQAYFSFKNDKEIKSLFIVLYLLGVALIVIEGMTVSLFSSGVIYNILAFVLALVVLINASKKEKVLAKKKRK